MQRPSDQTTEGQDSSYPYDEVSRRRDDAAIRGTGWQFDTMSSLESSKSPLSILAMHTTSNYMLAIEHSSLPSCLFMKGITPSQGVALLDNGLASVNF